MAELACQPFGVTASGQKVELWTLCAGRYSVQVLTYGGAIRSFVVPVGKERRDIVLGCETLDQYETQTAYLGALIGRVANRIGGSSFNLDGSCYPLDANDGPNCLHGGFHGFDKVVWQAAGKDGCLVLNHVSPNGDGGFPGTLWVQVTFMLTEDGTLTLDFWAESDAETLCSLTSHIYFNLLGHACGSLAGQKIQIWSDTVTEIDENSTPTGRMLPVGGTPFDLRRPTEFLQGLSMAHPQLEKGSGYDHNFALTVSPDGSMKLAACVTGGGLCMECFTTQPGLQLYTANYLDGVFGKDGFEYGPRSAFCLETQGWPDAVHHAGFPSAVLHTGEIYHHTTSFRVKELAEESDR